MKNLFVISVIFLISFQSIYAADNYFSIGISYSSLETSYEDKDHGLSLYLSGYRIEDYFIFGGYGEFSLSESLLLGKGGAIIGLCNVTTNGLFYSIVSKIGLGGGVYNKTAGATYQYGGEISIGYNRGVMLFTSYEKVLNLYNISTLNNNELTNSSIGLKISL